MITTIIFDLSEVLIAGLIGIEKQLAQLVNLPEDEFLESLWTESFWLLMKGKISEDEYLLDVFEKNKWAADISVFKNVIRKNFHHKVEGMTELIERLNKDYQLILLSDHSAEWVKYIDSIHPFLKLFNKKYFSFQSGKIKRERQVFELLLNENKLSPAKCLFIDDSEANIMAAREAGLNVICFKNANQLKRELEAYKLFM